MRVGIFGGSFNPPHMGHLLLARAAYAEGGLDKVIFIPCGNPPHKSKSEFAAAEDRLEMTRLLIDGEHGFEVSDMEIMSSEKSYTANTLEKLKKLYPDWELCFIVGEDSLRDMKDWYMPERIFANAEILAAVRGGMEHSDFDETADIYRREYGAVIRKIEMKETAASSTEIRKSVAGGDEKVYTLTDKVEEYIREKGIYREKQSVENGH